jgi:hypothetical protein
VKGFVAFCILRHPCDTLRHLLTFDADLLQAMHGTHDAVDAPILNSSIHNVKDPPTLLAELRCDKARRSKALAAL